MKDSNFIFQNKKYEYFNHPYNNTRINERTVEVPISLDFLYQFSPHVVEVGCVTPYYINAQHEIIDLVDDHPKSKKQDAVDFDYKGKNVLSISTIEHIGRNDYGIQEKEKNSAIELCQKIINDSLNYFITWPLGYNLILDEWAFKNTNGIFLSRRDDDKSLWVEKTKDDLTIDNKTYGSFHCANSIIILTNSI
jgi:hypothetical protein